MKSIIASLAALGALSTMLIAAPAQASPDFTFSVTNTIGTVAGTFTGRILGLTDNATSSATQVFIDTFPAGLDSLEAAPVEATLWDQQYENSFTVSGGQIVDGGFWAQQTINALPYGYQLYLNGAIGNGFNFLNLDGDDTRYVWGDNGFAAANFAPLGAQDVPEPGTFALFGAGLAASGLLLRNRKSRR